MKINHTNIRNATQTYQSQQIKVEKNDRNIKIEDKVEISKEAREARVQQLKQQIDAGTYQIDPQKIAEKMINFWKKG